MALVLLCYSFSALAITEAEHESIKAIIYDCQNIHYYNDSECYEVLLSLQIELPEWLACMYLPLIRGCPYV
jgi:hypothetical protein